MTLYLNINRISICLIILLLLSSLKGSSQEAKTSVDTLQLSIRLADAILEGDTLAFDSIFVTGIDVNFAAFEGVTPLMYAAQEGNLYFMKKLLTAGANVNQLPDNEISALQSAVVSNRIETVKFLIENGATVNTRDRRGDSPLLSAAQTNNPAMIRLLLESGARVNDSDDYGSTAIHYAAAFGNDSLVEFLIDFGADFNIKEIQGFTPLMVATSQNFNSTAELLLSYGADLNAVNKEGYSALTIAILNGNTYLAELFLLNGADGNLLSRKAKDHWYFSKGTGKYMRKVLRESDVKRNLLPVFGDWAAGMKFGLTENHFSTSIIFGVKETKYNFWIQTAFGLTPFVYSSFTEINEKTYQFWKRNYRLSIETDKYVAFVNTYKKEWGIFVGVNAEYDFGTYRGTNYKPDSEFNMLPVGGVFWRQEFGEMRFGYKKNLFGDNKPGEVELQIHFYFGGI